MLFCVVPGLRFTLLASADIGMACRSLQKPLLLFVGNVWFASEKCGFWRLVQFMEAGRVGCWLGTTQNKLPRHHQEHCNSTWTTRLSSNNALIQFLLEGTPEIREHYIDSKKDVDRHLKSACEQFIQQQTKQFVAPLEEFLTKVSALKTMATQGGPKYNLLQQPWAHPAKVGDLVSSTYRTIKTKLPATLRSMSLYLANKDTEFILFKPVKNNIQQVFQKLHSLLKEEFSNEDLQIVACPSMEQVNLLLSVTK